MTARSIPPEGPESGDEANDEARQKSLPEAPPNRRPDLGAEQGRQRGVERGGQRRPMSGPSETWLLDLHSVGGDVGLRLRIDLNRRAAPLAARIDPAD